MYSIKIKVDKIVTKKMVRKKITDPTLPLCTKPWSTWTSFFWTVSSDCEGFNGHVSLMGMDRDYPFSLQQ